MSPPFHFDRSFCDAARPLGTLDAGLAKSQIDSAIEQTTAHGRGLDRFDFSIALLTARFTGRTPNRRAQEAQPHHVQAG
jgi:hypothetical protein